MPASPAPPGLVRPIEAPAASLPRGRRVSACSAAVVLAGCPGCSWLCGRNDPGSGRALVLLGPGRGASSCRAGQVSGAARCGSRAGGGSGSWVFNRLHRWLR